MAPNTVQQPATQKLVNKMNKQAINQYGAGLGQNVFMHVGQNTLMNNNLTAFSLSANTTHLEKRIPDGSNFGAKKDSEGGDVKTMVEQ